MCGSCSSASGRRSRLSATHVIVFLLLAALAVVSIVGLTLRLRGGNAAAGDCSHLAVDQTAYQERMSRDLPSGRSALIGDTSAFLAHIRIEGADSCADFRSFVKGSRRTLEIACGPCAQSLRRSVGGF